MGEKNLEPRVLTSTLPLPSGVATLSVPLPLDEDDYADLNDWLQVVLRPVARAAGVEVPTFGLVEAGEGSGDGNG